MRKIVRAILRKHYGNKDFNQMWERYQREKYKTKYDDICVRIHFHKL